MRVRPPRPSEAMVAPNPLGWLGLRPADDFQGPIRVVKPCDRPGAPCKVPILWMGLPPGCRRPPHPTRRPGADAAARRVPVAHSALGHASTNHHSFQSCCCINGKPPDGFATSRRHGKTGGSRRPAGKELMCVQGGQNAAENMKGRLQVGIQSGCQTGADQWACGCAAEGSSKGTKGSKGTGEENGRAGCFQTAFMQRGVGSRGNRMNKIGGRHIGK